MESLFIRIYQYFHTRKGLLVVTVALAITLCIGLALRIDFEEDISKIMPSDEGIEAINEVFQNTDFTDRLVFLVSANDTSRQVETSDKLIQYCKSFIEKVPTSLDTSSIKEISYRVDQHVIQDLYNVIYDNLPIFLEESDYKQIINRIQPDTIDEFVKGIYKSLLTPGGSFIKKFVLRDPLAFTSFPLNRIQAFQLDEKFTLEDGYIITSDHKHLLFFITPHQSSNETQQNSQLITAIDNLLSELKRDHPSVNTTYFGGVAVAVANARQVRRDVTRTVSIALFVLLSLILFFFRRLPVFFYLVIPTIVGGIMALGLMYLFRGEVSIIALGIGSVLLGITLDYSLHVFTHHRESGDPKKGLSDLSTPILVSSCTTAVAFLCLYFVRSEALRDLGLFAALSVILASICSLIILPHLLPTRSKGDNEQVSNQNTFLDRIAVYQFRQPKVLMVLLLAATVASVFFAPNVEFESDLNNINYMSDDLIVAENKLNSITDATRRGVYLMAKGKTLDEALENSKSILPILDSLKDNDFVSNYASVNTVLPSPSTQVQRINRWNSFWANSSVDSISSTLKTGGKKFGFRSNTFEQFDRLLVKQYQPVPSEKFKPLIDVVFAEYISEKKELTTILSIARVDLGQTAGVYSTFQKNKKVSILDKSYLIARFVDILRADFGKLVLWSSLLVFLLLHLIYGRLELAIITFLPVAISWLWTLALMTLFGLKLNIINVIITTFIFGLGIDYSIFVMRGLLQEYKHGVNNLPTYKTSILLSVITTLVGIGVMIFAKHPALRSIASVSIIGILSVVFLALVLQPILFRWLIKSPKGQPRTFPLTLTNVPGTLLKYLVLALLLTVFTPAILLTYLLFFISSTTQQTIRSSIIQVISKIYLWVSTFGNYSIINKNHITNSTSSIVICNHTSHFDMLLLAAILPHVTFELNTIKYQNLFTRLLLFLNYQKPTHKFLQDDDLGINFCHVYFIPNDGSNQEVIATAQQHALHLSADILPIYLHGVNRLAPPNIGWQQHGKITIKIDALQAVANTHPTSLIESYHKTSNEFTNTSSSPRFLRSRLFENYLYRGSISWYYMLVKVRLEENYELFDRIIPRQAHIIDIGCGYGFMTYMLMMRSLDRTFLGIDYDEEKILTAQHCPDNNDRIDFKSGDIRAMELVSADVFILADILHYLPEADQYPLLDRIVTHLNPNGIIILRDGDSDLAEKHINTKWTERFSTGLGFNKTKNELHFISSTELSAWAKLNSLTMEKIAEYEKTSNTVFVFRKM